jgi:beta-lactam-binding protein with PASTA domain
MQLRPNSPDLPDTDASAQDEETTLAEDDWPVAEHYRVSSDQGLAAEDGATVVTSPAEQPPTRPGPLRSRETGLLLALAAVGALLLLAGIGAWFFTRDDAQAVETAPPVTTSAQPTPTDPTSTTGTTARPSEEVPSVVGRSLPAAREALEDAGLRASVRRVDSNEPRDEVLRQTPPAGAERPGTEVVALTVSNGTPPEPRTVSAPSVVGLTAREAAGALRDAGLTARIRTVRASDPAGTVVAQTPPPGTQVEPGTSVEVRVAKPSPPVRVAVPGVVGSTLVEARQQLRDAGLRSTVERVPSPEPAGSVVGQSPAAGARVSKDQAVALRVSSGPDEIAVPDVTGLDEEAARAELQAAGFRVTVVTEPTTDASQDGLVVSQDPSGGSSAREESRVTLTIARLS